MGTRYRVTVERIDDVEGTEYGTRDTTLFEAVSVAPERLAAYAAAEVTAALDVSAFGAKLDEQAEREVPANGDDDAEAKPKRKRRTKAEMEADRAREAAENDEALAEQERRATGPQPAPSEPGMAEASQPDAAPAPAAPYNPFA